MVSAAELERMMKLQDVILKALAKVDQLDRCGGDRRCFRPDDAADQGEV